MGLFFIDLNNFLHPVKIRDTRASSLQRSWWLAFTTEESVMQYMLLIHSEEGGWANLTKAEQEQGMAAYTAYGQALKAAGAYVSADRLQPSSATSTVRVKDGKTKVLNGPYAESKEQLAGYYQIEAKDLDAAVAWAAKCPGAHHGVMEVRPIWPT
jgi:hypothetical protein